MTISKQKLIEGLKQFYGSTTAYYLPLFSKYRYTEGVKYLAVNAGAYWLLEYIFLKQSDVAIEGLQFQVWKIIVADDNSAVIRLEDGDMKHIKSFELTYTDFPIKEFSLWFIDEILLLPSEY